MDYRWTCLAGLLLAACGSEPGSEDGTFPLYVAANGSGVVASTPAGINCGEICAASYQAGTQVTLSASPAETFQGWSGACTGAGTVCSVEIDAPTSVTATFRTGGGGGGGGTCTGDPCSLTDQCGCSDGEACDLEPDTGVIECRPVSGNGTEANSCGAADDCAVGLSCLTTGAASSCRRFCSADGDCPGAGGICLYPLAVDGAELPNVRVCTDHCVPPTAAGCPEAWACRAYPSENSGYFTDCGDAGSAGDLQPCAALEDCQAGFACITLEGGAGCLHYCGLPGGSECAAFEGSVCTALEPPLLVGSSEFGVCF